MINIKTKKEIEVIRAGGIILANIIEKLKKEIVPGVSTAYLEKMACDLIKVAGGRPSFKGYNSGSGKPFPTALCSSINNEVVHGPSLPARILKEGDIIGLDLGMEYPFKKGERGYFTDMAVTVGVGKISDEAKKIIRVAQKSLELAIAVVKPGATLNDIGSTVQNYVESNGFSVVRDLVGHGVGAAVHEEPHVPNYAIKKEHDITLEEGMVLAIEPMVNAGGYDIKTSKNGFAIKTKDGKLSAHFEHTIAVVKDGVLVLTKYDE